MVVLLIVMQSVLFAPGEAVVYRQELAPAKCEEAKAGLMTAVAPPQYSFSIHCLPK